MHKEIPLKFKVEGVVGEQPLIEALAHGIVIPVAQFLKRRWAPWKVIMK